jgi:sarcosine oxidase subunit alpha
MSGFRVDGRGRVDRARTIAFVFDGVRRLGYAGDTLASALLADGVSLVGRSFKLHRPRGIVTAGPEEPCALVELGEGGRREPNTPATTVELHEGLVAASQNRWPSLRFDLLALNGVLAPLLPAGFYYKTFMWPGPFWERLYEPAIRRAAGLGRVAAERDPDAYEIVHDHCDVLVVGSGAAGLAAARLAGEAGARVILAEQDFELGGGALLEPAAEPWREAMIAALAKPPDLRILTRTAVVGAYGSGVFAAVERRARRVDGAPRQTLRVIRARAAILATGATERIVAFPGNDRPGVMLAGAGRAYLARYGVAVGRRVALFAADDEAYGAAFDLAEVPGVKIAAIVDPRPASRAAEEARRRGMNVLAGHEICGAVGRPSLHGVDVRPAGGGFVDHVSVDVLLVSGGWTPAASLASQARGRLAWDDACSGFVPPARYEGVASVGSLRGARGSGAAAADAVREAADVVRALGFAAEVAFDLPPADAPATPPRPLWEVAGKGKAFVDLQHDVTADDVRLAAREGYEHVEHMKRYTTHGMGTDQNRIGGLVGSAVLAAARGVTVAEVGVPTYRPYAQPVAWGALAGPEVGAHYKPKRLLPLHDWHERAGATFVKIGTLLRPLVYGGDASWGAVLQEARAVRRSVGLTDMSSLGKIDVRGPDAATFLDRVYANTFSTLPVGRARYGLMLREDGIVLDDGTTSRFAPDHFLVTTTTQKMDDVLAHLEWHAETVWPELEVALTNVADHWAQFALAGPNARRVLERIVEQTDVSNAGFPFMATGPARVAGVGGRLYRISFSGELAYEIAVPADAAERVWTAALEAGAEFGVIPYGLDALNVLRIEKGHVTGAELNGTTTADDLGLGKMLKKTGDFVGRALAGRPGLTAPDRLQLVGLRALNPAERLRGGAHLLVREGGKSEGYVTSACMAAEGEGWIALALLAGGRGRFGERLAAASPVFGEHVAVEVVNPHRVDPENARVRA